MIKIPDESLNCFDDFWEEVTQSHHFNGGFRMSEAINGKIQQDPTLPAPAKDYYGHLWHVPGGIGLGDGSIWVCTKDDLGTYAWAKFDLGNLIGDKLFSSYAPVIITDTTDELSQFSPTGLGSQTLPGNFFTPGKVIRIRTRGYISTGNGQPATFSIYLGPHTMFTGTTIMPNGLSDGYVEMVFDVICYSDGINGKLRGAGRTFFPNNQPITGVMMRPLVMTTDLTVDTTIPLKVDMTYKWTNKLAANSLTIVMSHIKIE